MININNRSNFFSLSPAQEIFDSLIKFRGRKINSLGFE